MITRNFFLATILLLFLFHYSPAQESMLGDVSYPYLEKLVATAKENYPKVQAYQRKVHEAELNINKAKLAWFNALNLTYLYSPTNSVTLVNPTYTGGFQFGVFFNIGAFLTNGPSVKTAKEDLQIALLDKKEYDLNIEAMVKERYFTYVQAQALLNWRMKDVTQAEGSMKDIKYKFEKGEETFENYNKAVAFNSTVVQAKIQAEGAMLIAKSRLEEIIGTSLESVK